MSKDHHTVNGDNFLQNILELRALVSKLKNRQDELKVDFEKLGKELKADLEKLGEIINSLSQEMKTPAVNTQQSQEDREEPH